MQTAATTADYAIKQVGYGRFVLSNDTTNQAIHVDSGIYDTFQDAKEMERNGEAGSEAHTAIMEHLNELFNTSN